MRRSGMALAAVVLLAMPVRGEVLRVRQPVARAVARGASHAYELTLPAASFVTLTVLEADIDLNVDVLDPAGEALAAGVVEFHARLSFMTRREGVYQVLLTTFPQTSENGRYTIEVTEVRAPRPGDAQRLEAQAALREAALVLRKPEAGTVRAAVAPLERALTGWRALGDCQGEADALYALAVARLLLDDPSVQQAFEEALAAQRAIGDRRGEATTLYQLAMLRRKAGDIGKAGALFAESAVQFRELGFAAGEAQARNSLGLLANAAGQQHEALEHYHAAVELSRTIGLPFEEALYQNNIAASETALGDWRQALTYFDRAVTIYRRIGERRELANTLTNIGSSFASLGEYEEALAQFRMALPIARELGDRRLEATALINSGATLTELGEPAQARELLAEGLALAERIEDLRVQALGVRGLARLEEKAQQPARALAQHERTLTLCRVTGNRRGEAYALLAAGTMQRKLGTNGAARAAIEQALVLACELDDPRLEAAARVERARLARDADPAAAWQDVDAALALVESVRGNVASQHLRTAYLSTVRDHYEEALAVLLRLHARAPSAGYDVLALQISERARARGLLDVLSEAQVDLRRGAEPTLLARDRQLRDALNEKAAVLVRNPAGRAKATQEIEAILAELRTVEAELRTASPAYAALTRPRPASLREIQHEVLDDDTMLLEVALGGERSALWQVTTTSVALHELPPRQVIETLARTLHAALTERNRTVAGESPQARVTRLARAKHDFADAARELSALLLLDGALPKPRLLVVAEGALQYVPFAALPGAAGRPLVEDHEVVSMPSVSALAALRRQTATRPAGGGTVAVVADPVFSEHDPRVTGSAVRLVSSELRRASSESGAVTLPRLPRTRGEAEAILRLVPAGTSRAALDFDANRESVTAGSLRGYRYVHFATHGLMNSVHPELSGIVLSLVDEDGRPEDGFLRLHDIYNLDLPADLVVLSACQTALGKDVRAEGLLGLTRGFMYAGAARVVSSLWSIDDRATAELMKRFYARMLGEEHLAPAAALRAAQLELARSSRWSDPYDWAAFVLQGEWR